MYQAAFYDHADRLYHLRDDQKGWHSFEYWPTYYVAHPKGELETLDGTRVAPVRKMEDWKDPKYYEKDVDKITRLLVDLYYETDDIPSYQNIVYLDIECEIAGALTPESIQAAPTKVTSVSLYDNNTKQYICLLLDEKNKLTPADEPNKVVLPFETERDLLSAFLKTSDKKIKYIGKLGTLAIFGIEKDEKFQLKQIMSVIKSGQEEFIIPDEILSSNDNIEKLMENAVDLLLTI
jgi:hypothetical protein